MDWRRPSDGLGQWLDFHGIPLNTFQTASRIAEFFQVDTGLIGNQRSRLDKGVSAGYFR